MCSRPVTLGGGNSRVKTRGASFAGGVLTANSFSRTQYSAQRASMAPGSYALGSSWDMRDERESGYYRWGENRVNSGPGYYDVRGFCYTPRRRGGGRGERGAGRASGRTAGTGN
jgi:hypothetical protein